jgi:phosphatidylcholine synthase
MPLFAWLVHAFTASGALLAFLALGDAVRGDFRRAFLWLVMATVVDAVDGALARLAHVKERTPQFDGGRLDDIVDYLTFVFVPAFIIQRAGLIPAGFLGSLVVGAMLLASAYGFSRQDAKTSDHFFTGFPSYWNIVALYMVALALTPAVNAAILLGLAALVFVPIGYVYPSRTPQLRALTVSFGLVWAVLMIAVIWALPTPPFWLTMLSLVYPAYYMLLSFYLQTRRV